MFGFTSDIVTVVSPGSDWFWMGRPLESVYTIETPVSSLPTTSNISRKQYGQKYNTRMLLVCVYVTALQHTQQPTIITELMYLWMLSRNVYLWIRRWNILKHLGRIFPRSWRAKPLLWRLFFFRYIDAIIFSTRLVCFLGSEPSRYYCGSMGWK